MDEPGEGGSVSQGSRVPHALLVSNTKKRIKESNTNASNNQMASPVVQVSSQTSLQDAAVRIFHHTNVENQLLTSSSETAQWHVPPKCGAPVNDAIQHPEYVPFLCGFPKAVHTTRRRLANKQFAIGDPQDYESSEEALKELFVGIGNFIGNFSDKNEGMVVQFGGVSDFTPHARRRTSHKPKQEDVQKQLIDALDQILEECPRDTTNRKEWLGNALEKSSIDRMLSAQSQLCRPGPKALLAGRSNQCEAGRHSLELSLDSRFPIKFVDFGCVSLGPRIGQHVLYLKTQY
ncbi:hypothetical protein IWX48DRAFT_590392 [Phyllosticta citricarpa]